MIRVLEGCKANEDNALVVIRMKLPNANDFGVLITCLGNRIYPIQSSFEMFLRENIDR